MPPTKRPASVQPSLAKVETALERSASYLREVSLFDEIKDNLPAIQGFAKILELKTYAVGSRMFTEGEIGHEMFFLLEGSASVFKKTSEGELYKVATLSDQEHAFFGEGALLVADARSATIQADQECHCLLLRAEAFEKFCVDRPDWALPILKRIAQTVSLRLRTTNDDLMLLYNALVAEIRGH